MLLHAACPRFLFLRSPSTSHPRRASSSALARTCSLLFTHRLGRLLGILLECGCGLALLTWLPLGLCTQTTCIYRGQFRKVDSPHHSQPWLSLLCWPESGGKTKLFICALTKCSHCWWLMSGLNKVLIGTGNTCSLTVHANSFRTYFHMKRAVYCQTWWVTNYGKT